LADVSYDLSKPGQSIGMYLTARCPVGCAHCSVDSRVDSPTVSDYDLLGKIVHELSRREKLRSVGISGGEPFVERRGLVMAVDEISAGGKGIALFTSGVWAQRREIPAWIRSTLRKVSCVFLSTDSYHAANVQNKVFVRAVQTIVEEGVWLIVQVLRTDADAAARLLEDALGSDWQTCAEISLISPLPYGRGASLFVLGDSWPAKAFGRCSLSVSPLVRYDGMVAACCNEEVIMGKGSERLRRSCASVEEIVTALDEYVSDPLLRGLHAVGAGPIASHPRYRHLQDKPFKSICHLCWAMQDVTPQADGDPVLSAAALVGEVGVLS
jgi:organic radical activating enzyme